MKIGFIGDMHGNYGALAFSLRQFADMDVTTLVQVGDFGIWPGTQGATFVHKTELLLKNYGQTLYVIPGNHEDYDQIENIPVSFEDGWQRLTERILLAPRGLRWIWDGVTFVALGGAGSPDRFARIQDEKLNHNKSWWWQEAVTEEDVELVTSLGDVDVMICHDAPLGVKMIEERIESNRLNFKLWDLEYVEESRKLITDAVRATHPKILFHGHHHIPVMETLNLSGRLTNIVGLAREALPGSLATFDTETKQAVLLDTREAMERYFA